MGLWDDAEVISSYTAEEAIADGFLYQVPDNLVQVAGLSGVHRLTGGVIDLCERVATDHAPCVHQFIHVLNCLAVERRFQGKPDLQSTVEFTVILGGEEYRLWACYDGTSGPAVHIMRPSEY